MKAFGVMAIVAALFAVAAPAATPEPRAFQRPAGAADRYSGLHSRWRITDSRLVARLVVRRPNRVNTARLFLVRRANGSFCIALRDRDAEGASCTASSAFRKVLLLSSRLLAGVAANGITRVVAVGTRGVSHTVKLTRDKGFIWDCRAWNGCRSVVAAIEAYDRAGKLVYRTNW